MKFVLIIGDGAVGKMTVGQEIEEITDLNLFHNHMTIEPVIKIFGSYNQTVITRLRKVVFEEFAKSNNYGLIFTYMWAFDMEDDTKYINSIIDLFKENNSDIYVIELVADLETRLARNVTENRLINKASKRDLEASNNRVIDATNKYRLVSNEGELKFENYLKIDNTNLDASVVARLIVDKFNL